MKDELRRRFDHDVAQVKSILRQWDPIGVSPDSPESSCRDEYDDYAPQLLSLLYANAARSQVADRLEYLRTSIMGLPADRVRDEQIAAELVRLDLHRGEATHGEAVPPPLSPKAAEVTRREWRELGFFYICDDVAKQWRLSGSRAGLLRFAQLADRYASDPEMAGISEHCHYGPHMYLEFMTSETTGIDAHAIHGSQRDIKRLADLLRQKLDCAQMGDVLVINEEYAENCPYSIALFVQDDSFDPASADPQLGAR